MVVILDVGCYLPVDKYSVTPCVHVAMFCAICDLIFSVLSVFLFSLFDLYLIYRVFSLGGIHSNVFLTRQILIYDSPKNHFGD
jgi:hypothetical protein